jgi:hypothetical protein
MFTEDDLIHCYTRREAIEDGTLIDVTPTAREAGFVIPVALTAAVWERCVRVPAGVPFQDESARLWDLLFMLAYDILSNGGKYITSMPFCLRVRNDSGDGDPPKVEMKAVCGPDDDGSLCLTVMLPDED